MAFISHSVGQRSTNNRADVLSIQKAFNATAGVGSPPPPLPETGVITQALHDRIHTLQSTFTASPDGRINPRGATVQRLWPTEYANPTGRAIRGRDAYGGGNHGAARGRRIHDGTDYVSVPGQSVGAPMSGKVVRYSRPYAVGVDANVLSGIEIHASNGNTCQIWYINPTANIIGSIVRAGENIGVALTLQNRHTPLAAGAMTEHVHVRIHNRFNRQIDPGTLIPAANFPNRVNNEHGVNRPANQYLPRGAAQQGVHLHHQNPPVRGPLP